jgi:NTE family protein
MPYRLAGAVIALALAGCASVVVPPPAHPPRAEPLVPIRKVDGPVIAFVLGGGGARGFAHAGALKVLDEAGIQADVVVGTSAGSIFGAIYAGGIRNRALVDAALAVQREDLVDFVFPNRGFIDGERLQAYIDRVLGARLIEQLDVPFVAVATDLRTGALVAFNRGDPGMAVRASCSVPAVFQPTAIDGRDYVDGGLVSPVPVGVARQLGADVVIAIDVSRQPGDTEDLDSTPGMLNQAFVIMENAIKREGIRHADIVIHPDLSAVSVLDLSTREIAIRAGEDAARAELPRILRLIEDNKTAKAGKAPLPR